MKSMQSKKKNRKNIRPRSTDIPNKFNSKLFIALGLLLVVLLMKKYDLAIGDFNVDSLYDVVYHDEDLNSIKDRVFFFKEKPIETEDSLNTLQKEEDQDNPNMDVEDIMPTKDDDNPSSIDQTTGEDHEDLDSTVLEDLTNEEANDETNNSE
ncbi:MAG: hypothetical protein CVV02_14845 [Firmicutes bacterium HGW-Firmicutes-7]|nr:MAG: hypothetical protein CVV02_14845 [Firmicutes bacterium HGW-Firmicutes-7]